MRASASSSLMSATGPRTWQLRKARVRPGDGRGAKILVAEEGKGASRGGKGAKILVAEEGKGASRGWEGGQEPGS